MDAAAETSDDLLALLRDGAEAGAAPAPAGEEGDPLEDLLGFAVELVTNPPPEIAAARAAAVPTPAPAPTAASARAPSAAPAPSAAEEAAAGRFTLSTIEEHMRKKGMWGGALRRITIPDLLGAVPAPAAPAAAGADAPGGPTAARPSLLIVEIKRDHTPALLKAFDEIVVNASDHATGQDGAPPAQRVTRIDISFDEGSGRVSVHNDGPGIPVVRHAAASERAGRDVYVPEVIFAWPLSGSNIDKDPASVKGGINGVGAKFANAQAAEFNVETVDAATRRFYLQQCRGRLADVRPPIVVDLAGAHGLPAASTKPHTRVSFVPAYAELGYPVGGGRLAPADAADLGAWLRLRAHQTAAYLGPRVAVSYNGARCETTGAAALARLLLTPLGDEAAAAVVLPARAAAADDPYKRRPWDVAVVVLPPGLKAGRRAGQGSLAIVNGVVSNKGPHVQYLKEAVRAAAEDRVRKATKRRRPAAAAKPGAAVADVLAKAGPAPKRKGAAGAAAAPAKKKDADDKALPMGEALSAVRIVACCPTPGAEWGGQRKDELQIPAEVPRRYALAAAFLGRVGDAVAERVLQADAAKRGRVDHKKYTRARHAGRAQRAHTLLMTGEGDSALTLLRAGLTQARGGAAAAPGGPTLDWCGMISIQGVPLNAFEEATELRTGDGKTILVPSAKLRANQRFAALADAFGLRYDCRYETAEELRTLNYGQLVLCVDQDLDGTGKIASLVLGWLFAFWPALFRAGRVGRFMTPLVRAWPKRGAGPLLEFYYEEEFRRWAAEDPARAAAHHVKYYKGLAGHDKDEVRRMFEPAAFRAALYTYEHDEVAARLFKVYLGGEARLRKEALLSPVAHLSAAEAAELRRTRRIPLGRVQLDVDTKAYKNDAIKRQIAGGPDGLNPARRKALVGIRRRYKGQAGAKALKVFQISGYVADKLHYHHGDASLNATIVYLAQAFPGARKYPYVIGDGQFGSRHGDEAGSARYVGVRPGPLAKAAFPAADEWHLPHVFEDGERAEPQYFVPVAPMAALESYRIVSEGWNHDSHGRDLGAVLAVVEAYLAGEPELAAAAARLHAEGPTPAALAEVGRLAERWPLPPCTRGHRGEVRPCRGAAHSYGAYVWDAAARLLTVTELPMGVTTAAYLESLLKPGKNDAPNPRAALIEDIRDASSEDAVLLEITLRPGAFEQVEAAYGDAETDPLEDAFKLRGPLRAHLNYYSAEGAVLEFGECYLAAILYWAPLRRDLYAARVGRARIVARLRVREEEETLRYIAAAAELDLGAAADDEAAAAALRARAFPPLDRALLHEPGYTPNADLERLVTGGPGASFDYLLDLKLRDMVQSAVAKRRQTLVRLREDLARASAQLDERPVACASVWRAELETFKSVVARGVATGWTFK